MNKKYYLLTMVLLGGMILHSQINAKSTNTHVSNKISKSSEQQPISNSSTSDIQDTPVLRPQVGQILFSGNTKIASDELRKSIPLKTQDVANENVIMDSMVKIAQLYKAKNIKITIAPSIERSAANVTNIHFEIHETPMNKQ